MPLVYVLILNFCSAADTLACVEAVRQSDYPNFRLLVIDNSSPDGSGPLLAQKIPPDEFIQMSQNTGYAGGNNYGMSLALKRGADYVFVVNPDVRFAVETIAQCVAIMEAQQTIGALNPIQLDGTGKALDEKFRLGIFERDKIPEPDLASDRTQNWDTSTLYGAALLLSRKTLLEVGGFDPLFFAYGEEEDLARRIQLSGLRLTVTTAGAIMHLRSKESSVSDFVLFLRIKGLYLTILKDPNLGMMLAIRRLLKHVWLDLNLKRLDQYPFKQFPVTRMHVLRAFLWIAVRLPAVMHHRQLDRIASYLPKV